MRHETVGSSEIIIEHGHRRAAVSFVAAVSESSIISLVHTIDELREKRYYQDIELRIASPGGAILALEYFLEALRHWKKNGLKLTTRALTSCSSAAAIMLSLGTHRRRASPTSRLLYHFSRIRTRDDETLTHADIRMLEESMKMTDEELLHALISRATRNRFDEADFSRTDLLRLEELRQSLGRRTKETEPTRWLRQWTQSAQSEEWDMWETLYRTLCESDRSISGRLAHALGLIDELVEQGETHIETETRKPTQDRSIRIPGWEQLYAQAEVGTQSMRRHTLVMGETGSGKTSSVILPIIDAIHRSPEVGTILVIDPKREIDETVESLALHDTGKRIVRIDTDTVKVDLMASEEWSIDDLLEEKHYWSAAERVLQRIAGFKATNPARILIGKTPPGHDGYWDHDGLELATAVVAIAIWWCNERSSTERLIRKNIEKSAGWTNIWDLFTKLHGKDWDDYIETIRDDYAREFGRVTQTGTADETRGNKQHEQQERRSEPKRVTGKIDHGAIWYEATGYYMAHGSEPYDERRRREQELLMRILRRTTTPAERDAHEKAYDIYLRGTLERLVQDIASGISDVGTIAKMVAALDRKPPTTHGEMKPSADWRFKLRDVLSPPTGPPPERAQARESPTDLPTMERETAFLTTLEHFRQHAKHHVAVRTPNIIGVAKRILNELFALEANGPKEIVQAMEERSGEFEAIISTIRRFTELREAEKQYLGCHGIASMILQDFARPGIEHTIYFGCEPTVRASTQGHPTLLDFRTDMLRSDPREGVMYIYQPSRHLHDELIAKACKALFFEAILDSPKRRKPGHDMPMAGYVADEFQQFITADRTHGEQSFLDICRSFGGFAVLACQSVASLRYALCEMEDGEHKRSSAIDIIWNNTGTKIFFRSTDEETTRRVKVISPILGDGTSVIASRPLSTLRPGECYASLPDGRFMRVKIEMHEQHPTDRPTDLPNDVRKTKEI